MNDAERLCRDPAMRCVVGNRAIRGAAASASQMGRFRDGMADPTEEPRCTRRFARQWIDAAHQRHPPQIVVLDMDSSESPTYGEQEGSAYNGASCGQATFTALMVGMGCWSR